MNAHLTPDMLINRAPHKPLSPFKVRRRGVGPQDPELVRPSAYAEAAREAA